MSRIFILALSLIVVVSIIVLSRAQDHPRVAGEE
jgi:hypothetical protein